MAAAGAVAAEAVAVAVDFVADVEEVGGEGGAVVIVAIAVAAIVAIAVAIAVVFAAVIVGGARTASVSSSNRSRVLRALS